MKCLIIEMLFLLLPIIVGAETQECGIVTRNGNEVTIVADEIRAVDALVNTLAQSFGVLVSTEEPEYRFAGDFESVRTALPDWSGRTSESGRVGSEAPPDRDSISYLSDWCSRRRTRLTSTDRTEGERADTIWLSSGH